MSELSESLFRSKSYKQHLLDAEKSGLVAAKGFRSKLAEAAGCNSPFVSHVLNGAAHFSPEQALRISLFLGHEDDETKFFLLLVQYERAGTADLRAFHEKQISAILDSRTVVKNRLKVKEKLTLEDKVRYYSSWEYAAAHVLLTISDFQTLDTVAERLKIPRVRAQQVLVSLTQMGLVRKKQDRYEVTESRIHIGTDSELVFQHHTNWRLKVLPALAAKGIHDLHYSSAVTISKEDAKKLQSLTLDFLARINPIIDASPAEDIYSFCLDFYRL